jgi:hypothetical protein
LTFPDFCLQLVQVQKAISYHPLIVGLFHGFGFVSVLSDIGLPKLKIRNNIVKNDF